MSSDSVFVEEYRKELERTGYPFSGHRPVTTTTGYTLPYGMIADASVYYESPSNLPSLTKIHKTKQEVVFHVGEYTAKLRLKTPTEVLELANANGVFGGILVLDTTKVIFLKSWMDGDHPVTPAASFCPRCLEYIPVNGLQRLRADNGSVFSGDVVIVAGSGGIFQTKTLRPGMTYVDINFSGDPTYQIRAGNTEYTTPVQAVEIHYIDEYEMVQDDPDLTEDLTPIVLSSGPSGAVGFMPCNTEDTNMSDDALRIGSAGSSVNLTLGGF